MTSAPVEASLFEHLMTLFSGSSTVRDFRHWFNEASWETDESLPESVYELASDIEHLGYIRDSGIWDDGGYVQQLRAEVETFRSTSPSRMDASHSSTLNPTPRVEARIA